MKPTAIKFVVSGSQPEAVQQAASRLASMYQAGGKVTRLYSKGAPEGGLPDDADVIIIVSSEAS